MASLIPKGTEVLAGLEMGGIPIATALSLETGLPCLLFVKSQGLWNLSVCRGFGCTRPTSLCIEDVITTGGQVVLSAQDLVKIGAKITNVLCVIHRGMDLSLSWPRLVLKCRLY